MDSIVICSLSFAIYFLLSSVLCPLVPVVFLGGGVCVCMCWWYIVQAFDSSLSLSYRTSDINTDTHTHIQNIYSSDLYTHRASHLFSCDFLSFVFFSLSTRNEELIVIYVHSFFPFQLICLLYLLFALSCGGLLLMFYVFVAVYAASAVVGWFFPLSLKTLPSTYRWNGCVLPNCIIFWHSLFFLFFFSNIVVDVDVVVGVRAFFRLAFLSLHLDFMLS